jgi:hypothetical protein
MKPKTLKQINKQLYKTLTDLHSAHREMDGKMDYPDKDRGWINDTLDIIEIKYLGHEPDGSDQEELASDGEPMLTDEEAYSELITRFNNTRIHLHH